MLQRFLFHIARDIPIQFVGARQLMTGKYISISSNCHHASDPLAYWKRIPVFLFPVQNRNHPITARYRIQTQKLPDEHIHSAARFHICTGKFQHSVIIFRQSQSSITCIFLPPWGLRCADDAHFPHPKAVHKLRCFQKRIQIVSVHICLDHYWKIICPAQTDGPDCILLSSFSSTKPVMMSDSVKRDLH